MIFAAEARRSGPTTGYHSPARAARPAVVSGRRYLDQGPGDSRRKPRSSSESREPSGNRAPNKIRAPNMIRAPNVIRAPNQIRFAGPNFGDSTARRQK